MKKTTCFVVAMISVASVSANTCTINTKTRAKPDPNKYALQYQMNYHQEALAKMPQRPVPTIRENKEAAKYRLQYHVQYKKQPLDAIKQQADIVHRKRGPLTTTPTFKITYKGKIGRFNNLVVDGNTTVFINQNTPNNTIEFATKGVYPTKLIDYAVRKGTLYISRFAKRNWNKEAQQPVYVYINTSTLHNLTVSRQASIIANNVHGNNMEIRTKDSGHIKLRGTYDVHRIVSKGVGSLNIEWVNSHHLTIMQTGNSQIHLAGKVNFVSVRATDYASTDMQFLRAKNAVIQTGDFSTVKVTAINDLSGFASDFSNILFYKTPKHLSRHNYASGNVMQMHYWN